MSSRGAIILARCYRAGARAWIGLNAWLITLARHDYAVQHPVLVGRARASERGWLKPKINVGEVGDAPPSRRSGPGKHRKMFTKKPIYKKTKKWINRRWPVHWASTNKEVD